MNNATKGPIALNVKFYDRFALLAIESIEVPNYRNGPLNRAKCKPGDCKPGKMFR